MDDDASANSLAITLAMLNMPGLKSDADISERLPITIVTAIVSPTARPSPRSVAPSMPDLADESMMRVDSHLVAPSPSAASLWRFGIAWSTSREMEAMIGRTITARIRPAASIPNPYTGPLEQRQSPEMRLRARAGQSAGATARGQIFPRGRRRCSGIAARSSTRNENGRSSHRGASSERKIATPMLRGRASRRARNEERSVPNISGRAPYSSCTGSHVLVARKFQPNFVIVSADPAYIS
jgi:hypothetical protein